MLLTEKLFISNNYYYCLIKQINFILKYLPTILILCQWLEGKRA